MIVVVITNTDVLISIAGSWWELLALLWYFPQLALLIPIREAHLSPLQVVQLLLSSLFSCWLLRCGAQLWYLLIFGMTSFN